jgi:hypothetical protein
MGELGPWERGEGLDEWREERGYRSCSFCGSLHPDEFMQALEAGAEVGPTDKPYKAYIDLQEIEPSSLRVISHVRPDHSPGFGQDWRPASEIDWSTVDDSGWRRESWASDELVLVQERGPSRRAKFYYQHLDQDQRARFVELHNAGNLNIGYPGGFYARPFFTRPTE